MTAQTFLRDQLIALAQQGWEVHLACSAEDGTDSFQKLQQLENVRVHMIPMFRRPHPIRDALSLWGWLRLIKELEPDLVISSTPKAGLLGAVASWMSGVTTRLYHIRGLRAEGLDGVMAMISRLSERIATSTSTHVLVDSPSLLVTLHSEGLLSDSKGQVLGSGSSCGVDTDWFRPPTSTERQAARESLGLSSTDIVIGFLGRLAVDKGIRELINASEILQQDYSRTKLTLVGPLEDSAQLDKHLRRIRSKDWARVAERTDDPRSFYWAFDIFCLPSYREGFPIAALEAQACGLPVVTTEATGCVDSIRPDITGYLVPPGDSAALATALSTLARSEIRLQAMGMAARDWVKSEFNKSIVDQRFIEFLNNVVTPTDRSQLGFPKTDSHLVSTLRDPQRMSTTNESGAPGAR